MYALHTVRAHGLGPRPMPLNESLVPCSRRPGMVSGGFRTERGLPKTDPVNRAITLFEVITAQQGPWRGSVR